MHGDTWSTHRNAGSMHGNVKALQGNTWQCVHCKEMQRNAAQCSTLPSHSRSANVASVRAEQRRGSSALQRGEGRELRQGEKGGHRRAELCIAYHGDGSAGKCASRGEKESGQTMRA
eukprot:6212414-Pleurochrysis_carterae.AAC.3